MLKLFSILTFIYSSPQAHATALAQQALGPAPGGAQPGVGRRRHLHGHRVLSAAGSGPHGHAHVVHPPGRVRQSAAHERDRAPAPPSLAAAVMLTQAASLRELHLLSSAAFLCGADIAALAALTGLQSLTLHLGDMLAEGWVYQPAAVVRTLSRLPALRRLEFLADWDAAKAVLPTVDDLTALRSPTLTRMEWNLTSTAVGTLALGALPVLASCQLNWARRGDHVLHVTPESFSGAAGITQLTLWGHAGLQLAPRCFSAFSQLAQLCLRYCSLTEVPGTISRVGQTLRRLDLSYNPALQLAPECLNSLSALAELDLSGCGLTGLPAALSGVGKSLRHLNLSFNPGLQMPTGCLGSFCKLAELMLCACELTAVPPALAGLEPKLRQRTLLRLDLSYNRGLQLAPLCLSSLDVLVEVDLQGCGLTGVPAALAGARRTLRRLDLRDNPELQLDCDGFDTLVTLQALEWLSLKRKVEGTRSMTSNAFLGGFLFVWQGLYRTSPLPIFLV